MSNGFNKILIANRGEIACRIMRTAQKMNIQIVAVYSDIDRNALFVHQADEAYLLEGENPSTVYLDGEQIIKIAQKSGAQAIHPGYGFLSENADFAGLCDKAGIVFIGPSVQNIVDMSQKGNARSLMTGFGVPVLPGYEGDEQSERIFAQKAQEIGFPVLLKASAGGGGKGMRVVNDLLEMSVQFQAVKREALKLFKNDHVILERYLQNPRHIEVQVFCDHHGKAVYLFERECSVQRRHQKIVEEAPAAHLSEELRKEMGEISVKAALAMGYRGAGTFEYLLDDQGRFYFMEMNTRLQVEHPVTEEITGVDLVKWQIEAAAGAHLSVTQADLRLKGHAIELRLCAEDVAQNFLPAIGQIQKLNWGNESASRRVETGIVEGDEISPYYDSMIAKLIVYGKDRDEAVNEMQKWLTEIRLYGLKTNLDFLGAILREYNFRKGRYSTSFIPKHYQSLLLDMSLEREQYMAMSCMALLEEPRDHATLWQALGNYRMNLSCHKQIRLGCEDRIYELRTLQHDHSGLWDVELKMEAQQVFAASNVSLNYVIEKEIIEIKLSQETVHFSYVRLGNSCHFHRLGRHYEIMYIDPLAPREAVIESQGHVVSPMPGKVVDVLAKTGQKVAKGEPLIVVEAMKMEHILTAPYDGIVKECFYKTGEQVQEGVTLLDLEQEVAANKEGSIKECQLRKIS